MGTAAGLKLNWHNLSDADLMAQRICDLKLELKGSCLEPLVQTLYRELDAAGIKFKPQMYLSDEWGCPHGVPIIGIPFYLSNPRLYKLEMQYSGGEPENSCETMELLRHETGHALNYAYRLYDHKSWQRVFGKFSQPYREVYQTRPFSPRFVRHVPGWYVQKHPDEDFAETFAVWLTPGSDWRQTYSNTPALAKLLYVDRTLSRYGGQHPPITGGEPDCPVEGLGITLESWYRACRAGLQGRVDLPDIISEDLVRLLPEKEGRPAADILEARKKMLIQNINYWTGLDRHLLAALLNVLFDRMRSLKLKVSAEKNDCQLINITAFVTALAMNHQLTGRFVDK